MFRRDVKKQFNESKYNLLARKGANQKTHMVKVPYQKHLVGTVALVFLGFNYTKRFYTMPHAHKDTSKPMTMFNGELHPYEIQPKSAAGMPVYEKHKF